MKSSLTQLASGKSLTDQQAAEVFEAIMTGQAAAAQVGALLAFLQARGPTISEIVGAARVMRSKLLPVRVPDGLKVIDTCGTGGTHSSTFNISTSAGLVAAAAGRPHGLAVAKHGNRSVTSASGSSQVLETLGVKLSVSPLTLTRCLDEIGYCFCFAPNHHPAMKHAAPIRAELGFRTIFNLLGPLTNPASAQYQVMGVYDPALTEPIAQVLGQLGSVEALVVHGSLGQSGASSQGLGELTTTGPTRISRWHQGKIETFDLDARELGLALISPKEIQVDSPQASAAMVRLALSPKSSGPAAEIVRLNAAAALWVGGVARDLAEGLILAKQAVDSGKAQETLAKLVEMTNQSEA